MSLLVTGKVGTGGKMFAALLARELVRPGALEPGPAVLAGQRLRGEGFDLDVRQGQIRVDGSCWRGQGWRARGSQGRRVARRPRGWIGLVGGR